ncbi:MAG: Gfo/Idh/MocA family oxidoreductase [Planctomycetota bacterium]
MQERVEGSATGTTRPPSPPSVLVIGARRAQQGIGEFVARSFHDAGARVAAIVGTTAPTLLEARDALARRHGIHCHGYVNLIEALEVERPNIVAVCSPIAAHHRQLERVAAAGAHCLCEKPMWWADLPQLELVRETGALVDEFIARNGYLALITQWPATLATYWTLYPEVQGETVKSLAMLMGPTHYGPRMVLDAAPHLISLLQALVGLGEVEVPAVEWAASRREVTVRFRYRPVNGATVAAQLELRQTPAPPRPAGYAINGRWVERVIELPAYDMSFVAAGRRTPLPDPLAQHVQQFLHCVDAGKSADRPALVEGMRALAMLHSAAHASFPGEIPTVAP